jgi:hypothetical protein
MEAGSAIPEKDLALLHLLNEYFLSILLVPSTVLGACDANSEQNRQKIPADAADIVPVETNDINNMIITNKNK